MVVDLVFVVGALMVQSPLPMSQSFPLKSPCDSFPVLTCENEKEANNKVVVVIMIRIIVFVFEIVL